MDNVHYSPMKLIELTEQESFNYKAFFTEGLQAHRDCFRISPADEASEPFPTKATPDSFTLGILTDNNNLAGVVSFQREGQTRQKIRHKGLLFRMYVAAEHSGRGYGRALLDELIRRVRAQTDIEQINLTVVETNINAKRQYEKLGFQTFSVELNALKDTGVYYDEVQMVLFLNR
jgi:ribosomal protein S18 acetylase RimI-like enzyme